MTIALNGMLVSPGDLVVGDADGLIAIPSAQVGAVYEAAAAKQRDEAAQMAAIDAGENDRSWVDRALLARGCSGVESASR